MAVVRVQMFEGIAPKVPARYLGPGQAQIALNCPTFSGSLRPLKDLGASLLTLPKSGTPQTIYRFGQDVVSDTQYWFHWDEDVDVCRGQIAGDTSEWTFYTGDGAPKATYAALATSGPEYPAASRALGLPAPTVAPAVAVSGDLTAPTETGAIVVLTPSVLQFVGPPYWSPIDISTTTDKNTEYISVGPPSGDPVDVADAINGSAAAVTATADAVAGTVTIETTATGVDAALFVRYVRGIAPDTEGTFTPDVSPDKSASGTADTVVPRVILTDNEIGSISSGDTITITTEAGTVGSAAATGTMTPTTLAAFINDKVGGKVVAAVYGSCVVISPGTEGGGATGKITYSREVDGGEVTAETAEGSEEPAPAELFLTKDADIDPAVNQFMELKVGTYTFHKPVSADTYAGIYELNAFLPHGVELDFYGTQEPFAVVKTTVLGSNTSLRYRVGNYEDAKTVIAASGATPTQTATLESRVYAYTWIAEEAGLTMESAPSPPSATVDVEFGGSQVVEVSGFDSVPSGAYNVTGKRIYRATNGVYLFVAEVSAATASYDDSLTSEQLGEELPSLYWSPPPDTLEGLINLPNGMMAGFVGRDVYFCEPYRPYAWPEPYMQTVDYPVVGLGRMDTTLAVLTTGVPYFMQGSHPDSIAVVKSDIAQACVSKRSIVSAAGAVVYASPDGLILLSPGGSRNLTEALFDYKTWQAHFAPTSIHAYAHDNQYIAFYDNGVVSGGFIYDLASGQFTMHDIYAEAGYTDLQRDRLFLAKSDKSLRVWNDGASKTYLWRSKVFTMPQNTGFSCAQVEAESYPVTLRVYADGVLKHTETVQSRDPFRLPSGVARDWELEIEGTAEVFAANLSTSMTELAGA